MTGTGPPGDVTGPGEAGATPGSPRDPPAVATERPGVVAFDNSGTLSRSDVEVLDVGGDPEFQRRVPSIPGHRRAALVSLDRTGFADFETDEPLGAVLQAGDHRLHLTLSNGDTTVEEAAAAAQEEGTVPARRVADAVEGLVRRVDPPEPGREAPVAVQFVVDLDARRVHRVLAYTSVPVPDARGVVDAVRDRGYEPHIVSGDAPHILEGIAETLGVAPGNVHAYQSAAGKRHVVESLRSRYRGPVVMVGDYVNDRHAFDVADRALLVANGEDPDPDLSRRTDAVATHLGRVPDLL